MWLRLLLFGSFSLPYFASVLVRSRRSVFPFHLRDGDDGIRTHDPLLAGQVLSQLSYTPMSVTHRPLTLFFCFYNEQGMNLVHNRLPLENSSSMRDFQVLAGFLSIPASRHASTTHSKLNNNIPDSYLIPSWYSNQPFSLERR